MFICKYYQNQCNKLKNLDKESGKVYKRGQSLRITEKLILSDNRRKYDE